MAALSGSPHFRDVIVKAAISKAPVAGPNDLVKFAMSKEHRTELNPDFESETEKEKTAVACIVEEVGVWVKDKRGNSSVQNGGAEKNRI